MKTRLVLSIALTLMASTSAFARSQANHPLDHITSTADTSYTQMIAQDGAERQLNTVAQDGAERQLNTVAQDGAERQLNTVAQDGAERQLNFVS
ncbi:MULTISPECIES: hypothetical protein [Pseudomonas]|uniref:Phage infection protein n=1 Tax=Pseudomonas quercus TaxID=2722792 RepID=A0ABX0Y9K6_9PSED|nr:MULTISPECIES: hypothetical protein [Pseudomonas]MBF7141171.1 hypothetical protein [Pseudomonas sp. LY10J]NJO99705.1 hypothetical protein [Pseudomonas quercus]